MELKKLNQRNFLIIGLLVAVLAGFGITLSKVQIIDGPKYVAQHAASTRDVPMKAARGIILDRNGVPMVENRQSVSIIFENPFFPSKEQQAERNTLLASLIALFEENQTPWIDALPLTLDAAGAASFLEGKEEDIAWLKSREVLGLNQYATAQNCMDAIVEKYQLQDYPLDMARKIASVCVNMKRLNYSTTTPYTFAQDVGETLVSKIKERSGFYRGVNTEIVPIRLYTDGAVAPHILGRVGAISPADLAAHQDEGYVLTDEYGAEGIERAAESFLRGKDGMKQVSVDPAGNATSSVVQAPEQGDTIILTLDTNLQKMVQETFPRVMNASTNRWDVDPAGAVVVLDVNNFEVLACVSYPGYDISKYLQQRPQLEKDPLSPAWNRALLATYEPGSTIKLSVALAALQEGLITKTYTFRCTGTYHFLDSTFKCPQVYLHPNQSLNVEDAIVDSCNSFFYEQGRRLGYERINAYRSAMGLGQDTGTELPEAVGVMDSPERRAAQGQDWFAGYNVQTAIGQNNLFTPMQLAVYAATVANGGTRYQAHFIQSIRKAGTMEMVKASEPTVLGTTGVDKEYYDIVRQAMYRNGKNASSYAGRLFKDLPIDVGAKTGTSQVYRTINGQRVLTTNGIFVSFAPFDKPEIAVIVVGEGCKNSEPVVPIVHDIYAYYFGSLAHVDPPQSENVLL
ncbi:MAG: hypothetical protein LBJ11_01895 [Oscillospiraceae bacterium]|jgi:penicillin-binding protein 2|nr:hypothetical protein [Oscillospiraceae bacterium]